MTQHDGTRRPDPELWTYVPPSPTYGAASWERHIWRDGCQRYESVAVWDHDLTRDPPTTTSPERDWIAVAGGYAWSVWQAPYPGATLAHVAGDMTMVPGIRGLALAMLEAARAGLPAGTPAGLPLLHPCPPPVSWWRRLLRIGGGR
jgi:hypothetical protein